MGRSFNQNLKAMLKINIIAITIMVCAIAINSSYFLDIKDLPEKNFVNISFTKYVTENCDTADSDCNEETVTLKGFASGVAFKSDEEFSYILTADHFCDPTDISEIMFPISDHALDFWITDHQGVSQVADIVYSDSIFDLCILRSKMKIENEVYVADKIPKMGEKVYAISAPHGMQENDISFHFEGLFSGCDINDMCFFTIPATSGSSGSLVLDKRGSVIGMIQMTIVGFENISMGVGSRSIKLFLDQASEETGIQF